MPKFMLLISPERLRPDARSPSELGEQAVAALEWIDDLRQTGFLVSGSLFGKTSYRLSVDTEDQAWPESTGAVLGPGAPIRLCFSVEADTMDDALELAKRCPTARPGTIDVFEIEAQLPMETNR